MLDCGYAGARRGGPPLPEQRGDGAVHGGLRRRWVAPRRVGQGGGHGAEKRAFRGGISPFWPRCGSGSAGGRSVKPVKIWRWMEPCDSAGGAGVRWAPSRV